MTPEAQVLISNKDRQPIERGEVDRVIEADATSVLRTAIENVDGVRDSVSKLPKIFQEAYERSEKIADLEGVVIKAIGRKQYQKLLPEIQEEVNTHFPGVDLSPIKEISDFEDGVTEILNVKNRLDGYFTEVIDSSRSS